MKEGFVKISTKDIEVIRTIIQVIQNYVGAKLIIPKDYFEIKKDINNSLINRIITELVLNNQIDKVNIELISKKSNQLETTVQVENKKQKTSTNEDVKNVKSNTTLKPMRSENQKKICEYLQDGKERKNSELVKALNIKADILAQSLKALEKKGIVSKVSRGIWQLNSNQEEKAIQYDNKIQYDKEIIAYLSRGWKMTVTEFSKKLNIEYSTVKKILEDLEKEGVLERIGQNYEIARTKIFDNEYFHPIIDYIMTRENFNKRRLKALYPDNELIIEYIINQLNGKHIRNNPDTDFYVVINKSRILYCIKNHKISNNAQIKKYVEPIDARTINEIVKLAITKKEIELSRNGYYTLLKQL